MARILVVDDDPHMREVLELVLADGNRAVDSVGSGEAALSGSRGRPTTSSCVICNCRIWTACRCTTRSLRTTQAPVVGKPLEINVDCFYARRKDLRDRPLRGRRHEPEAEVASELCAAGRGPTTGLRPVRRCSRGATRA